MWKFKNPELFKIYNKNEVAKYLGISNVTLRGTVAGKINCSKKIAFMITKFLNSNAEIEDYFERIGE